MRKARTRPRFTRYKRRKGKTKPRSEYKRSYFRRECY